MNKIGLITDIHGNKEALLAALRLLDEENCNEIIHLGDVVDIGPDCKDCLEILLERKDVTCLLGNHDRDFVINRTEAHGFSHVPSEHKKQVFDGLNESLRRAVMQFPLSVTRNCGGKQLLFCHYALKSQPFDWQNYPFMPLCDTLTVDFLDEIFADVHADAVFFGHKHEPCDILGRILYVDVGSVGCHPDPVAKAVVIEYDDAAWSYRRIQAPYDRDSVERKMRRQTVAGDALFDYYFMHKC